MLLLPVHRAVISSRCLNCGYEPIEHLEQPVDRASFVGLDDRDPQSGRQHLDNEGVVEQAAIAAGSAFIGSMVGGGFALLAGRQEWRSSLQSRSHEAAARVVNYLGSQPSLGIIGSVWEYRGTDRGPGFLAFRDYVNQGRHLCDSVTTPLWVLVAAN